MKISSTVASIRNTWFQNNLYLHLYGSLTVLEPKFGNTAIFVMHVEYLNTQQQGEKEEDSCINVKVLLNTAQKIRFN